MVVLEAEVERVKGRLAERDKDCEKERAAYQESEKRVKEGDALVGAPRPIASAPARASRRAPSPFRYENLQACASSVSRRQGDRSAMSPIHAPMRTAVCMEADLRHRVHGGKPPTLLCSARSDPTPPVAVSAAGSV